MHHTRPQSRGSGGVGKAKMAEAQSEQPRKSEHKCSVCGAEFRRLGKYREHFRAASHGAPWQEEQVLRELYEESGLTTEEIGDELGCAQSTVIKWMDRHGIERRGREEYVPSGDDHHFYGGREGTPDELSNEDWVRQKYLEEELSMYAIASELGCSRGPVRSAFDRFDIETDPYRYENCFGPETEYEPLADEAWLRKQYESKDRRVPDIADEVGCVPATVYKWLNEHNIETESPGGCVGAGENHHNWNGGRVNYYGESWHPQRRRARQRDNCACQGCGISDEAHKEEVGEELHVHHITPLRQFESREEGNKLKNLITLCRGCHDKWEGIPLRPENDA